MKRFFGAVQFLTLVPAPSDAATAATALFFPLVGALLGGSAGLVLLAASHAFSAPVAALLALSLLVLATGGLHEDGLADVCDAFRAGRPAERIHAILKDSRIGTYGAVGLMLALLLRWQSIAALGPRAVVGLAASSGAARGAIVLLAWMSRPAGAGLGKAFCTGLRGPAVFAVAVQTAALPFLCGPVAGAVALVVNGAALLLLRAYFHARIDGVTGDCLGAASQITETLMLLIFTCRFFI
jgi:adenosylcobinamide-GDP ribazoletransferase